MGGGWHSPADDETERDPFIEGINAPQPGASHHRHAHRHMESRDPSAAFWLVPTLLTLILGLVGVGHRQLWQDEYATWWAATLSWSDLGRLLHHIDAVLAPYYAFMHLWIGLFGHSAAAMRVPSVLAMAATAATVAHVGRRLFDPWTGMTAGLILAAIPMTTRYAQEARPYAFAVLAAVLATLFLLRTLQSPSLGHWASYGVMVCVTGLAHLVALTILAAHLAAVIPAAQRREGLLLRWSATTALGLLPVLPLAYIGHTQDQQIAWLNTSSRSLWALPSQLFDSTTAAWGLTAAGIIGALLTRKHAIWLLLWAVLPPVALFASREWLNLFLSRYLLFTLPAWALLCAAALAAVTRLLPKTITAASWRIVTGLAAAAALIVLTLPDVTQVRSNPLPGEPDWHAGAKFVIAHDGPRDALAFNGHRGGSRALAYQLQGTHPALRDVFAADTPQAEGTYEARRCPQPDICAANTMRIWLFSTEPQGHSFSAMPGNIAKVLSTQYHVKAAWNFKSLRVLLLTRTGAS